MLGATNFPFFPFFLFRGENTKLKEYHLKILGELLKNARRSDRAIAIAVGVSQPTVTRLRTQLENLNIIQGYAALPNFSEIGFEFIAVTIIKNPTTDEVQQRIGHLDCVMLLLRGIGMEDVGTVICISIHKNFFSYTAFKECLRDMENRSFLASTGLHGILTPLHFGMQLTR
jgi:DNA-binding Lrp family transcriptional regulator